MSIEAFHRGDMEALREAAARCQDSVWALTRRGFVAREGDVSMLVEGVSDHDLAEHLTIDVLARLLAPRARQTIANVDDIEHAALQLARQVLRDHAERAGRITSLSSDAERGQKPRDVEDLDAMIEARSTPSLDAISTDVATSQWREAALQTCAKIESSEDDRTRALIQLRWREGRTPAEVATTFTCGEAAVRAHESRLRRRLARALKLAHPERPHGHATVDALLTDSCFDARPSPVTRARILRGTLTRTDQTEPPPFGQRLAWGLGATAVAALGWGLMFTGVLPHPDQDPVIEPKAEVVCPSGCQPDAAAKISVLAPRDASRVSAWIKTDQGPKPVLVGPHGGSIRLPMGADTTLLPLPYDGRWPGGGEGQAVTVIFSESHLSRSDAEHIAMNGPTAEGITAITVTAK